MKKKILIVFGTRPEFIKLVPLIKEFEKNKRYFNVVLCSTGQHKEMLKSLLTFFNVIPKWEMNVMKENQSLSELSAIIFNKIDYILKEEKPDLVIVQGDTTTAFITALVAFYNKIKVAHVEAGLRTKTKYFPFPEELNRRIISEIADFHFTPTDEAHNNLRHYDGQAFMVGNTGIDTVEWIRNKLDLKNVYNDVVLVTVHRRESFGKPLQNICKAVKQLAKKNKTTQFFIPVHPNPNVKKTIYNMLNNIDNVKLMRSLNYNEIIRLISNVKYIITDSGGIQEEAHSFKKHVFVLRNETERMEGVKVGFATLVGTETKNIVDVISKWRDKNNITYNPYGDGRTSYRIVELLKEHI